MKSKAKFVGSPKAEWLIGPEEDRAMRLLEEFIFEDSSGKKWNAPSGSVIDGASIPASLWSVVGSPYTGNYRRASILHDVACDRAKTPKEREAADKMFYEACIVGGCSINQARLLYAGVRIGAWSPDVRLWKMETNLVPAIARGNTDLTAQDLSVLNTFREIADDLTKLGANARFKTVTNVVERHLAAKARQ